MYIYKYDITYIYIYILYIIFLRYYATVYIIYESTVVLVNFVSAWQFLSVRKISRKASPDRLVFHGSTVAQDATSWWSSLVPPSDLIGLIQNGGLHADIAQDDMDGISV